MRNIAFTYRLDEFNDLWITVEGTERRCATQEERDEFFAEYPAVAVQLGWLIDMTGIQRRTTGEDGAQNDVAVRRGVA